MSLINILEGASVRPLDGLVFGSSFRGITE